MGGGNLCPAVQMEEIKPHNDQLAGRQFVRYSLRDFRGGNSRLRASRLQEHDFMQLESLWPWVYNMGGI